MNKHIVVVAILSLLTFIAAVILFNSFHAGKNKIIKSNVLFEPDMVDVTTPHDPNVTHSTLNMLTIPASKTLPAASTSDFYIGLSLACSSSIFIGASFIFKKKGLIKLSKLGTRAGDGGYGYLKEPLWWAGLLLMAGGETANFAAYAFAPASLVTPLGALSVLVAAVLSSKFLNENLNLIGKVGCALSIVGSTVIIVHAPKEQDVQRMADLLDKLINPGFIVYVVIIAILSCVTIFYFAPRKGQTNVTIYILICSAIGSLSVMGCKGIGLAVKQTFEGDQQFTYWLTYFFIVQVAFCISVQMIYLNRALDTFNTSVVTPIYYVFFTTFVIIASAVLFREWVDLDAKDIIGNICGFLTVIGGIFLLNAFKDMNISWRDVSSTKRRVAENDMEINGLLSSSRTEEDDLQSLVHEGA